MHHIFAPLFLVEETFNVNYLILKKMLLEIYMSIAPEYDTVLPLKIELVKERS